MGLQDCRSSSFTDINLNYSFDYGTALPRPQAPLRELKKEGSAGLNGRERIAKRLADLAFKMAADNSCSSESVLDHQERPLHVAFFDKKLPCPQTFYKDKKYFFFTKMASIIIFVQFTEKQLQTRSFVRHKYENAPRRRNIAMPRNISDLRAR